jgi:hypothetical protein
MATTTTTIVPLHPAIMAEVPLATVPLHPAIMVEVSLATTVVRLRAPSVINRKHLVLVNLVVVPLIVFPVLSTTVEVA